jgi:hypothetical protein
MKGRVAPMLSILNLGNKRTQIYILSFYFRRQNTLKGGVEKQEESEDDKRLKGRHRALYSSR